MARGAAPIADSVRHVHCLKHSRGTSLAERGVNPHRIKLILGHKSMSSTERYLHGSQKQAWAPAYTLSHLKSDIGSLAKLNHQLSGVRAAAKALGGSVEREVIGVKKRVLSAAGRAATAKAAKKRWAKIRAQAKKAVA
jgi:hypothetical protein